MSTIVPWTALVRQTQTAARRCPRPCYVAKWHSSRGFTTGRGLERDSKQTDGAAPTGTAATTATVASNSATPLRKHLKEEQKRKKAAAKATKTASSPSSTKLDPRLAKWELTVGIEIHAELNTARKLFSCASTVSHTNDEEALPNSHVAYFDAALPGSQPQFQPATLIPAIRAALALGCKIQSESSWDRKRYFHWDQPNGYQITQYRQPFATDGQLRLTADDGADAVDLQGSDAFVLGIKQVQLEQDTAKTVAFGGERTYHINFDRAGHPLIEIITLPQIHSPATAAAVVRKVQAALQAVDACVVGMELGGLRADVNVSVRERDVSSSRSAGSSYGGVTGLGQRTEIKNLASFKAVHDAIVAERDRQIDVLESGGRIEGETRGWTLGATETTRLRGKEGEVDYRYMPEPDLGPLLIGQDLVQHLQTTLPELPDETVARVMGTYGLTSKDAKTVVSLDDGDRLEFMEETASLYNDALSGAEHDADTAARSKVGRLVGNWVLHEIGGLLTSTDTQWSDLRITPRHLAAILLHLQRREITARVAKRLLIMLHEALDAESPTDNEAEELVITSLIDDHNLRLRPLTGEGYSSLIQNIMAENPEMVSAVRDKGQRGKMMWFVGEMIRRADEGTVDPEHAKKVVEQSFG